MQTETSFQKYPFQSPRPVVTILSRSITWSRSIMVISVKMISSRSRRRHRRWPHQIWAGNLGREHLPHSLSSVCGRGLCLLFGDHACWLGPKQNTWNICPQADDKRCKRYPRWRNSILKQSSVYWARNYYLLWVAWNWVINLRFVQPQKAAQRKFFHPVSRNP